MWCSEFIARGIRGVYFGIYLSTGKVDLKNPPTPTCCPGFALYYSGKSRKKKSKILEFIKKNSGNLDQCMHCGGLWNLRNTEIKFTKANKLFTEFDYSQIKLGRLGVRLVFKTEYQKLCEKKKR